jgi:hypothetical protein
VGGDGSAAVSNSFVRSVARSWCVRGRGHRSRPGKPPWHPTRARVQARREKTRLPNATASNVVCTSVVLQSGGSPHRPRAPKGRSPFRRGGGGKGGEKKKKMREGGVGRGGIERGPEGAVKSHFFWAGGVFRGKKPPPFFSKVTV